MFEHRREPPITRPQFIRRLRRHGRYALLLIAISLIVGMAGYHWIAGKSWTDSYLNTTMLLGGMGPVGDMEGTAGKLFAGTFALYSGLVFLAVAILLLTPVFHRVLHRFHWEADSHERHNG